MVGAPQEISAPVYDVVPLGCKNPKIILDLVSERAFQDPTAMVLDYLTHYRSAVNSIGSRLRPGLSPSADGV